MPQPTRSKRNLTAILALTAVLSIACRALFPGREESPSPTAAVLTPAPTRTRTAVPTGDTGGSRVVAACDVAAQTQAMRSSLAPDWEGLDLEACYRLQLEIPALPDKYSGAAQVTFVNITGEELNELVFRTYPNASRIYGGSLSITQALVDGIQVQPEVFLEDRTAVSLSLPEPLTAGETLEVELKFTGQVPENFGGSSRLYGVFNYSSGDQVLTLANWFPILAPWREGSWQAEPVVGIGDAVVSQAALYLVEVTVQEGWQLVGTGSRIDTGGSDSSNTTTFASGPVRDFFLAASPSFVLRTQQVDGVQINHWGLPDGEPRWDESLQATADSLTVFAERFGPYPYAELDIAEASLQLASGVEYPGVFLIGSQLYNPAPEEPFLLGIIVSHETAHQWWYGVVGNDVLTHPWQDEALATFSSLVYQQAYQPRYYQGTLNFYTERVADLEANQNDTAVDQPVENFADKPADYSPVVYTKGALFFAELRDQIGEEVFFNALQSYYLENMFRLASPQALLKAFETSCDCELDAFYVEWGVD